MLRAQLQARLKELAAAIKALSALETLTAEQLADLQTKTGEITAIEAQLKALDDAEAAVARTAAPANASTEAARVPATVETNKLKAAQKIGMLAAAMVKAQADNGTRGLNPTLDALEKMGFGELAGEFRSANFIGGRQRALNSATATAGGVLLPEDMSSDIIDILRPNATFFQGNPQIMPMPSGTFKQPAAASGASAAYRGETARIAVSQPTFKALNMSAKLLGAIVPISNQLIRWSLPNVQAWAQRDLSLAMGTKIDHTAFFGDGMADVPLGITKIPGVYRTASAATTAPTYTQVDADARKVINAMLATGLPAVGIEWRMALRVFQYLQDLRDGNGNHIYPTLQSDNPTFKTFPVRVTNQIAVNGGVTTDESEILLVAFGHVVFGDAMAMQLAVSDVASVVVGADTIHAFQQGVTFLKAEAEHDFDIKYFESVAVLESVRWGA